MTRSKQLQNKIVDELGVMEDDIHVTRDKDAMTFYLALDKFEEAETVLNRELEVLEEHEYEYLVRAEL
jgi:hypothetical protein